MTWLEQVVVEMLFDGDNWLPKHSIQWVVLEGNPYPLNTALSFVLAQLYVFMHLCPHSFSMVSVQLVLSQVYCTPDFCRTDQWLNIVSNPGDHLSVGIDSVLGILSSALHHSNSYLPQPERVRNSMLSTKPVLAWVWHCLLVKFHVAGHQGPPHTYGISFTSSSIKVLPHLSRIG